MRHCHFRRSERRERGLALVGGWTAWHPIGRRIGVAATLLGLPVSPGRGHVPVEPLGQSAGASAAVAVEENMAYVGMGPCLVVPDVSNPAQPTEVGRSEVLPGVVRGVAVSGNYAYVADYDGGLVILRVGQPGDLDGDGDVDGFDFLTFASCYNGSNRPPLPACLCSWSDAQSDSDVDGSDFLTFSDCFNGSNHPPRCP